MKKIYKSPKTSVFSMDDSLILCSSKLVDNTNIKSESSINSSIPKTVYSSLSHRQKIAAMNIMNIFGNYSQEALLFQDKICHIMDCEGLKMGVSCSEAFNYVNTFSGMRDMVRTLKGSNREALENLFFAYYCIIATYKSENAIKVLMNVYHDLGFSELECVEILEQATGIKKEML